MTEPRATCIVPCHDYAALLGHALASLAAQRGLDGPHGPLDGPRTAHQSDALEVVVSDDGSGDDSVAVAESFGPRFAPGRLAVLRGAHSGSPARARNRGLLRAHGAFCCCLDADDLLEPDYLAVCLAALEAGADVAYTDYVEFADPADASGAPNGDLDGPGRPSDERTVRLPDFDAALLRSQNIVTPCAVFRREVWTAVGGFRQDSDYEDWDFWVRAAAAGFRFVHLPHPLFRYRVHPGSFSERARARDGAAKAAIVLGSPQFFAPAVRAWARAVLADPEHVPAFPRGIIPGPGGLSAGTAP
ncbi:MAG: glycosyltransferase family 2 protein [Desulfovibrionaceae bacterium]|jgi:glycosyltransferase involved in cell wall biosynthesis|nr:glycosyltransferase family 2 protein [Desulfovibrionaceae bacterium]